jgi:REP element-mobilizing transposase RayT
LLRFGAATKTGTRRSVADVPHHQERRQAAKRELKHPPVHFTGVQAQSIGRGFARFAQRSGVNVLACSILPEHVHMVVSRHRYEAEQITNLLKGAATRQLSSHGLHPFASYAVPGERLPKIWARGQWKVFLNSNADISRAVRYVQDNPLKEGKQRQRWGFVRTVAAQNAPLWVAAKHADG